MSHQPETPNLPVCPRLYNLVTEAKTIEAVQAAYRHHDKFCLICGASKRRAA